jgi:hypothetical protein
MNRQDKKKKKAFPLNGTFCMSLVFPLAVLAMSLGLARRQ